MRVRLGQTLDGEIVRIDTTHSQTTLVLGDPGMGKTTLCRYLVRWWLARTEERVVVSAERHAEWADLNECTRLALHGQPVETAPPSPDDGQRVGLWVIDGLENAGSDFLNLVADRGGTVLVTALSTWGPEPATDVTRWGLTLQSSVPALSIAEPFLADPTQTRLDWGAGTEVLVPDLRGDADFPRHRWCVPEPSRTKTMVGAR